MAILEVIFWICTAIVLYAYVGYAVILAIVAKLRRREPRRVAGHTASVSFVLCGHNEEERIGDRIAELTAMLTASGIEGEVIVVSDGSTDHTASIARQVAGANVHVIELPHREGKAAALSAGCAEAQNEILIFADCRQRWDSAAVRMLLENFADPTIGAVSGDLVLEWAPGVMAAMGFYWRYEKWLRKKESQLHSTVGVTGAICAVRRSLFPGVPAGMILDDVYWPLYLTVQGQRVVHDKRAIAYDKLPERTSDEFRRKVRTLAGNFQLAVRLPQALLPWRNPVWLQFVSHKLLRLVVPWALLAMLATSAILPGSLYQAMFLGQVGFYALALIGNNRVVARQLRPAAAATSVVVLNAAAWMAFWVWITGRTSHSWGKVKYKGAILDRLQAR
ncbi:MAG TPA: glycosyltransferase family 2 protein [Gemmataceae bacterium]|nr:glycosyltransferase family 2 protein [Gemmataceae bacterium]